MNAKRTTATKANEELLKENRILHLAIAEKRGELATAEEDWQGWAEIENQEWVNKTLKAFRELMK
jgi:hypothetical protein